MIVLDTHVLLWWLTDPAQLSGAATRALAAVSVGAPAVVSAVSVLEIATAARRGRLAFNLPVEQWLAQAYTLSDIRFEPVSAAIAQTAGAFGDELHGDPADRVIAATALALSVPLVSADCKLRSAPGLRVVW